VLGNFVITLIYNDYSSTYDDLLEKSKLLSLKIRRIRTIATETFKIINKQSPVYLHDLIQIKQNKYYYRYKKNYSTIPQDIDDNVWVKFIQIFCGSNLE